MNFYRYLILLSVFVSMRLFLKILFSLLLIYSKNLLSQSPLTANFVSNTNCILKSNSVDFTDVSSSGSNVSYLWDFGDGSSSILQNPSHAYLNPGKYTVSLTITNSLTSSTESKVDYIKVYNNEIVELNDKPIMSMYEDSSKVDYLVA